MQNLAQSFAHSHWWYIEKKGGKKEFCVVSRCLSLSLYTLSGCMSMYHCINLALCPSHCFRLCAFPYHLPDTASPASGSLSGAPRGPCVLSEYHCAWLSLASTPQASSHSVNTPQRHTAKQSCPDSQQKAILSLWLPAALYSSDGTRPKFLLQISKYIDIASILW